MSPSPQVRRPLVAIAGCVVVGLQVHHLLGGSPLLWLGVSAFLLAWGCGRHSPRARLAGLYGACALLAATYSAIEHVERPSRSVLSVAEMISTDHEVIGRVDEASDSFEGDGALSFRFRVEAIRVGDEWLSSDAIVRVYLNGACQEVGYGERWRLIGRYRGYEELRAGQSGALFVDGDCAVRLHLAAGSFKAFCYRARHRAREILYRGMEHFPEQNQLLSALLLGYRRALSSTLYQMFAYTGSLHIFAISGLHVGVIASILIAVLKMMGLARPRWGVCLIPALFVYVVATGMKPSALRAFTMAAVYFAAPLLGRKPDSVSAIAVAAVFLLLLDPFQLQEPGFLLSFVVVSGIVMVHRYMTHQLAGYCRPRWAIPLAQLSGPRPLNALLRALGLLVLTSGAAWIFSVPLTAYFFNTISPVALVGNLFIIPLTFMILLTGCLTWLSAWIPGGLVLIFNYANRVFVTLLITLIRRLGGVPGGYVFVRSPSVWVMMLWYSGWVCLFVGPQRLRRMAAGLLLGAMLLWGGGAQRPFTGIEVHDCAGAIAVRLAVDRWVLVSDGNRYHLQQTIRCLQSEGVRRLEALVVSDRRANAQDIDQLCLLFRPQRVWVAPDSNERLLDLGKANGLLQRRSMEWNVENGALRIGSSIEPD